MRRWPEAEVWLLAMHAAISGGQPPTLAKETADAVIAAWKRRYPDHRAKVKGRGKRALPD